MKLIFSLLLFLTINRISAQEIGSPFIRNYASKEYNCSPQIWAITQDSKGILYFGVGEGILEFDGVKWTTTQMPNKAATRCLAINAKDRIFVGGVDELGYLEANHRGKKEFVSLKALIPEKDFKFGNVWHCKIWNEKVYFLTPDAIFEYTDSPKPSIKTYFAQKGNQLSGLSVHNGKAYAYESNRGLVCTKGDKLEIISDFYKDKLFWIALALPSDSLLIIPNQINNLYMYSPSKANSSKFHIQDSSFTADNDIYTAALLPKQRIALGTFNKGLLLLSKEGKSLQKVNENNSLQNNTIFTIYASSKQHLWLGLGNGISRTESNTAWTYWDKKAGLKGAVTDILRFENRLYMATTNAVYYLENGQVQEVKGIAAGQCWDLLEYNIPTNSEKILLAGTQNGIYEIKGGEATLVYAGGHAIKLAISTSNPNRLFSTDNAHFISLRYEKGVWEKEGFWENIKENEIYEIQEDARGYIWLGTYNAGITRVKPDYNHITKPLKVKYYTEKNGLPSLRTIYPYKIKGKIIFATEKGLYTYNPSNDRFEPYCDIDNRLCQQDILEIYENKDGGIWTLPFKNNKQNIAYLQPNNKGSYEYIYKPFRRMPEMEMECFYQDTGGVAWFGSSEGLFRYDKKEDSRNYEDDFYTLIRKVTDDRDSIISYSSNISDTQHRQELNYNDNSLKFEFAAPFFDAENKTLYSYQLVGFEDDWSNWSIETYAIYTNLQEGNYTFKVKAKNIYDKESIEDIYQITILPPWYRTWWAYLLYTTLSIFAVYGIVKWNTNRLTKEKTRLEGIVNERTQALQTSEGELRQNMEELETSQEELKTQKNKLEDAFEQLHHQNTKVNDSIRYAQRIQNAILPHENILEAAFAEHFIIFKPKDVVSGDFYWHLEIENKKFIAVVDCTGHGVPGAFMSMIGNTLLYEIINAKRIFEPHHILEELHLGILNSLNNKDSKIQDGMDIALCCIEEAKNQQVKVQFSGAKRPLYYFSNEELTEIQADRKSIGQSKSLQVSYTLNEIILQAGDTLYMTTDGWIDSINPERKRFGSKEFKEMLIKGANLPLKVQKEMFNHVFDDYGQGSEQRDDVLLVGVKV